MMVHALKNEENSQIKFKRKIRLIFLYFIIASVVFFVCLLGFTLFSYNNMSEVDKNHNPLFNTYVIISESMVPTIKINDAIVTKRVDDYSLKIGDIITFNSNYIFYKGLTITNRIIGIQQLSDGSKVYRTKGDNNVLPDSSLVHLDHVYGRVFFKIPKLGYIKNFVSSTGGFIISIVIPILFVILYEVFRIRKLIKLQDAEIEII